MVRISAGFDEVQAGVNYLVETARSQGRSDELVAGILREVADRLKAREPRGGALSAEQADYLITSGAMTERELGDAERDVAQGLLVGEERAAHDEVIADALTSSEVAEVLGIDASRVRHRQAKGGLYSFVIGRKRLYPLWQFALPAAMTEKVSGEPWHVVLSRPIVAYDPASSDSAKKPDLIPGLATLVKAIPEDMHPVAVQGFMTTDQQDLRTPLLGWTSNPVKWLKSGGDVQAVVDLLDSFLQS